MHLPTQALMPALLCGLAFTLAACGGGGGGGEPPAPPAPPPPNVTPAAGGTVNADDGRLRLTVPAGAASAPTSVSLTAIGNPPAPAGTQLLAGTTYTLAGNGSTLAADAQLDFTLSQPLPQGTRRGPDARKRALYAIPGAPCDVNGDGIVDSADAQLWTQGYSCWQAPTLANVNATGVIRLAVCSLGAGGITLSCRLSSLAPGILGVVFDTVAPTISVPTFTAPTSPAQVTAPGPYQMVAAASDNVGVVRVDFYKVVTQGNLVTRTLLHTDTTAPYEYGFTLSSADNGSWGLVAEAVDTAGNVAGRGASLVVNIPLPPAPDTVPPVASISISPPQVQVGQGSTVTVQASDNVGVVKVEIYRNGVKVAESASSAAAVQTLAHGAADVGTLAYQGRAYDAAGNMATVAADLTVLPGPNQAWVDAGAGSDGNAGTQAAPFKTLGQAFATVGGGGVVHLRGSTTFSNASEGIGNIFNGLVVPAGVAIKAQAFGAQTIGVTLRFTHGGSLENVVFDASGPGRVLASGGTVQLSRVRWFKGGATSIAYGIEASGNAVVQLDDGGSAGHDYVDGGLTGFASVQDAAELTVNGGQVSRSTGQSGGAYLLGGVARLNLNSTKVLNGNGTWVGGEGAIVAAGSANVVDIRFSQIDLANAPAACILQDHNQSGAGVVSTAISVLGSTLENCAGGGVQLREGQPSLTLINSTVRNNGSFAIWAGRIGFDGSSSGLWGRPLIGTSGSTLSGHLQGSISMNRGGSLRMVNNTLTGGARGITIGSEGSYELQVSGSAISGGTDAVWLGGDATSVFDFGDPSSIYNSAGGNTFSGGTAGLRLSVAAGVVVRAIGNTWAPNVQGADAAGHYSNAVCNGASPCEVSQGNGPNYLFANAGAGARLRLAP